MKKGAYLENLFKLPMPANETEIRILQLTDIHLFADKKKTLLGINTADSYSAVLEAIATQKQRFDLIITTGDLAQEPAITSYQYFARGMAELLPTPCVWLPGNHDDQRIMADVLFDAGITATKQVTIGDNWQILLLDSQVSEQPYGHLNDHQLLCMEQCLQMFPQRYTLVALHHPPLACGCRWLDQNNLRNASMLAEIVLRYPRVTTLLCGHIHQEIDLNWCGKRLLATPSTCIQFKPDHATFTLDNVAPGWRCINLQQDGTVKTQVKRLANGLFYPDINANGY